VTIQNATSEQVVDLVACSDERLLVLLQSGAIWNVRLRETMRDLVRKLADDKWDWSRIDGQAAVRVAWTESDTVATWQSLREMCKKPPVWKMVGADVA
jgi:hypothetical protein